MVRILSRVIYRCAEFSISRGFSLFVRLNFRNLSNGSDEFKRILLIGAVGQSSISPSFCFFFTSTFGEINRTRANRSDAPDRRSTQSQFFNTDSTSMTKLFITIRIAGTPMSLYCFGKKCLDSLIVGIDRTLVRCNRNNSKQMAQSLLLFDFSPSFRSRYRIGG